MRRGVVSLLLCCFAVGVAQAAVWERVPEAQQLARELARTYQTPQVFIERETSEGKAVWVRLSDTPYYEKGERALETEACRIVRKLMELEALRGRTEFVVDFMRLLQPDRGALYKFTLKPSDCPK